MTTFFFLLNYLTAYYLAPGSLSQPYFGTVIIILPFFLSTGKVLIPPKTGPCSYWPEVILKPALCNGQMILSPINNPLARLNPKCEHLLWVEYIFPW